MTTLPGNPNITLNGIDPREQQKQIAYNEELRKKYEEKKAAEAAAKATSPPPKRGFFGYLPGRRAVGIKAGRKTQKLGNTFNRCVKSVRSTVKARKGSTKESAAIAICTTSVLHPRGRTMKRYRKKRLITQRKFRGGDWKKTLGLRQKPPLSSTPPPETPEERAKRISEIPLDELPSHTPGTTVRNSFGLGQGGGRSRRSGTCA